VLRERHRIRPGEPEDFTIRDMTEMTNTLTSTTRLMTNLLLCVAMISLVVGGVGIMNIMLVSSPSARARSGCAWRSARGRGTSCGSFWWRPCPLPGGGAQGYCWARRVTPGRAAAALARRDVVAGHRRRRPGFGSVGIIFGFYPAWKASRLDLSTRCATNEENDLIQR